MKVQDETKEIPKSFMYHRTEAPKGLLFTDEQKAELGEGWVDSPKDWFRIESPQQKAMKTAEEIVNEIPDAPPKTGGSPSKPDKPKVNQDLLDEKVKLMLEKKTDLTQDGRPELPALKKLCKSNVTKEELDASLERIKG